MTDFDNVKVGDKIYGPFEKYPYKVRARDDRYIICTKPFNLKRTVIYFIIDTKLGIMGPDNAIFCSGYETDEQCQKRLEELQQGLIEVSRRRKININVTTEREK